MLRLSFLASALAVALPLGAAAQHRHAAPPAPPPAPQDAPPPAAPPPPAPADAATQPPSATILSTTPAEPSLAPFAAAVDRVERARVDALGVVRMSSAPALSLSDLQLAVGCVGENDACFGAIAGQLGVDVLLYATVDAAGDSRIVTLHYFDARGHAPAKEAQRQGAEADLVEQIEPMLREMFGLPPMAVVHAHVDDTHHEAPPPAHDPTMLILALASFGVAAVTAVIGAIFGALELSSADDYKRAVVTNEESSADAANAILHTAQDQATIANVMFVVTGVAVAAGATLLVLDLTSGPPHPSSHATVSLVPNGAGLTLRGTF